MLSLREAMKQNRLGEFIAQEEARGVLSVTGGFEEIVAAASVTPAAKLEPKRKRSKGRTSPKVRPVQNRR